MPGDEVYSVGFYGHAPLYDLGYVMAKAVTESDGDGALGRLISEPPEAFAKRYIELAKTKATLPQLGPLAQRWALRTDCPR